MKFFDGFNIVTHLAIFGRLDESIEQVEPILPSLLARIYGGSLIKIEFDNLIEYKDNTVSLMSEKYRGDIKWLFYYIWYDISINW